MKKFLSLLICVCVLFTLCACSKKENKKEDIADLKYYADLGQIPEADYSLGENPDTVVSELTERKNSETLQDSLTSEDYNNWEFTFEVFEGENNVLLDNGAICYYYNKANKDNGISYIVDYDTAFGLETGTLILDVKDAFASIEFTEETLTEENAFFAFTSYNGTILKAEFEKSTIIFVFQENELYATAIYNDNWNN